MPGQVYAVDTLGGNYSLPYLTDTFRHKAQPRFVFRQFINAMEAVGSGRGDTFEFPKAGDVETQGGTLVETNTIPRTQYVTNKGTATITEYGNAIPMTRKLQQLSQYDVENIVEKKLRDDAVKVLESAAGAQYVASDFVGVCVGTGSTAITTNGTATATATADLTASNLRDFVDFLRKRNVPTYDSRDYMCVASVQAMRGLHDDTGSGGWIDISKYTGNFAEAIHNGEVGRFYHTRFMEETGYLSNTIGNSSAHGQAVLFGDDYVYEATSIAEEIRYDEDDFGRSQALAWYALLGFKIVWDYAVDGEQHGIFITSA